MALYLAEDKRPTLKNTAQPLFSHYFYHCFPNNKTCCVCNIFVIKSCSPKPSITKPTPELFWTFLKNVRLSVFENSNSNSFSNLNHHHTSHHHHYHYIFIYFRIFIFRRLTHLPMWFKTQELQNLNWWGYSYRKLSVILSIT